MSVAQKEILVSHHDLQEIVKSLEKGSILGKNFDVACQSLRKLSDWTEQTTDPRNGKVLPSAYFLWNVDKEYTLVVPPNFDKPSRLEVRTGFSYLIDKNSNGLPDIRVLSKPHITERVHAGSGISDQRFMNTKRCIFDSLVNLDILFKVARESGANIDQIVERFADKKIGFKCSAASLDFAELESPVYFNYPKNQKGYMIIGLKSWREMRVRVVYRPQV